MDDLKRIRLKIKDDKRYKAIRNLYKTQDIFQIPISEYREECRAMFKGRRIRGLSLRDDNAVYKVAESIVQDQSYRSRMSEIYSLLSESCRTMEELLSRFSDYATVTFARDLKALGTVNERTKAIKASLETYYQYSAEARLLMEEIDIYIKDIDKAGFAFKSLVDTLELISQREFSIPTPKSKKKRS